MLKTVRVVLKMSHKTEYIQVITTIDSKVGAEKIAEVLIESHLAACVQIIGPIVSTYWWNEKIETSEEYLCLIKTKESCYKDVENTIKKIHNYDVPEIIACPITEGNKTYLDWISSVVKKE